MLGLLPLLGTSREMRRSRLKLFCPALSLLLLLLAGYACRKPGPQNIIRMADLHTQKQLLRGFYQLEAGAWRWTEKDFSVMLKVPEDASKKGGVLTLQGSLPPESVQNGPLEINSRIGDTTLKNKSFSKPGEIIYRVDVPPSALTTPLVAAEFSLNSTHRVPGDVRDLGVIATVIGLRAK
jgi:hypothetical protein